MTISLSDLHDKETRVTDQNTGGQKGKKLTQVGALDPVALIEVARVAGMGADKYAEFNYLKGYNWSLSFNAMMRHALLFWAGEDRDEESGLPHPAHVAWMAMSLVSFMDRGVGNDDRPPKLTLDNDDEGGYTRMSREALQSLVYLSNGSLKMEWNDGKPTISRVE